MHRSLSALRHCLYFNRLPCTVLLTYSSRFCSAASILARPLLPRSLLIMSRPATAPSFSPRGRVQCPICAMHLPSAHIQQHAAVCGLEEEKQQEDEVQEEGEAASSVGSEHNSRSKRKRQPPSSQQAPLASRRKQTARDRTSAQRQQPTPGSAVEEEKEGKQRVPRPLAFIDSPIAAIHSHSSSSRTSQSEASDSTTTIQKRRRIERTVITTYPPSSPILTYGTPGGAGGTSGAFQLQINIPSPSPPPLSPAQYANFSPLTTALSPAPSWLSYRVTAIPPPQPAAGLSARTSALRFLTYNVWFDDVHQRSRMAGLASLIASLQPDVIALQEVTPSLLSLLQRSAALHHYWLSPHPTSAPYFTLLLSKRQPTAMYRIPFISQMGRDLTAMVIDVTAEDVRGREGEVRRLIVSTSHLESLWQSKERRAQQLKQALTTLTTMAAYPHTSVSSSSSSTVSSLPPSTSLFFMGDTNLRGSECAPLVSSQHFVDLYPSLTATHPTNDAAGYTYDTVVNRMIAAMGRKRSRARYDRVMARVGEGLEVTGMWRAGMEPIQEDVWISDHFGLVTELTVS